MDVVKHIVRKLCQTKLRGIANGLLVGGFQSKMIEGNAQRSEAYGGKFAQVHFVLAENPSVHTLVEIDSPLYRTPSALKLRPRRKPEISDFCDDLSKLLRSHDVIVH